MPEVVDHSASESHPGPASGNRRLWLVGLPCLLLTVAVLYLFPLSSLSVLGLVLMLVGLSWCLYQYFLPLHLIRRHAMLEHVTSEHSYLRRWLWSGVWSRLCLLVWSLVMAATVLMLLNGYSAAQWWLMLAAVPVLLFLVPLGLRLAGAESGARYHFPLALRVAVYLTILLTTASLMTLELLGPGVPDTRHLSLLQLVSQSWAGAVDSAAVREIGWLLGAEAVLNDTVWYLMQQASALSEQSAALKLAAWLLFLLFVTLQAAVFWFVLAGALSWLCGGFQQDRLLRGIRPARLFVTGLCLLGVLTYLLAQPGVAGFVSVLADRSLQALPIPAADPCVRQRPNEIALITTSSAQRADGATTALQERLQQQLDDRLDEVFRSAEPAIERYLDWNFSLTGQYAQLLFLAQAVAESGMDNSNSATLQQGTEQRYASYTSRKIDEYVGAALAAPLQQTRVMMADEFRQQAEAVYLQQALHLEQLVGATDCLQRELPALLMPELAHKSAVGTGAVAGVVVAGIAARGSVRVGANVLTRNAAKRAVSAGAAKVVAKTAQSSGWSGLGLGCGPLAVVCVPAVFVATWLGTDLLINEVDESLNRAALRAEIMAALQTEQQRLKEEYRSVLQAGTARLTADVQQYRDQRFRILDQGI